MSDWEAANNAYLVASLRWLRLALTDVPAVPAADPVVAAAAPPALEAPAARRRRWGRRRPKTLPAVTAPVVTPAAVTEQEIQGAAEARTAAAAGEPPPALVDLAARLDLTDFERDVLLLAAARDLDPAIAELCAAAQADPARPYPTFALALRVFDERAWEALAPNRPLRRLQLVTLGPSPAGAVHAELRADERVVNLLKGLDHIDERLSSLQVPMGPEADAPVAPSQRRGVEAIVQWVRAVDRSRLVVCLTGPNSASKRIVARAVAAELGVYPVRLPAANLPPPGDALTELVRLWRRDCVLSPVALYLDAADEAGELSPDARAAIGRLLTQLDGLVFLDSRDPWPGLERTALVAEVANPTVDEQRAAWAAAMPADQAAVADELAAHFDLDPMTIGQLARVSEPASLWQAVLAATRPTLDVLGRRVQPKAGPDELVLPPAVLEEIERIKEQVRHRSTVYNDWGLAERVSRGLGISALFAGESGTGKTLAAEVIAADLGFDLYRIDLSGVVSKYIGETEKNLRRVFDAAEHGGTILCFDEADALFGKRSEVKDSLDRYANIEVNYLLQRIEEYRGLAILTTNMKDSIDHAFTRRMRFVVDFPFPGPAERAQIWRRAFVSALETDRLDFERLARLTLSGGGIHNVAVNAMFAAAASPDGVLTMPMVLAAARLEYRKNGLPVNEAAFELPATERIGAAG